MAPQSPERALARIKDAAARDPANAALLNELGNACVAANRPADAIAAYSRALALRPSFAQAHFNLGNVLNMQGRMEDAVASYRRAAVLAPRALPVLVNLGATLCRMGAQDEAAEVLRKAVAIDPRAFQAQFNLGIALSAQGRFDEAVASYENALRSDPRSVAAWFNLGQAQERQDRLDEAVRSYAEAARLDPSFAPGLTNLGSALLAQGKIEAAVEALRKALSADPAAAPALINLGQALERQERLDEAREAYERAAAIAPSCACYLNLGAVLRAQDRLEDSAAALERAVALDPRSAAAQIALGVTLERQGRLDEAIQCYERAGELDASEPLAPYNLGLALLLKGRLDDAFAALRRHAGLKFGASGAAAAAPPPHKQLHDAEQVDYLIEAGVEEPQFRRLKLATAGDPAALSAGLGAIHHLAGGARLAGPAVNPAHDRDAIEARWAESRPNIAVVDDLLTPEALSELRRFCWGSTIWRRAHGNGYLGAYSEEGFACPLLAQIADELRASLPGIFRRHLLRQWWAFKYDSRMTGINAHADFAAVNVNFWITPDEASLDPSSGGLVIWDVPAPLDWDFARYNGNPAEIHDFLARSGARSVTVPHRANRAVIFDSDLFHATDRIAFAEGYRNRRINVTLLYGMRHDAAAEPVTGR